MEKELNPVWLLFLRMSQMKYRHSCLKIVVTGNVFHRLASNCTYIARHFFLSGYFYFLTIIGQLSEDISFPISVTVSLPGHFPSKVRLTWTESSLMSRLSLNGYNGGTKKISPLIF